MLAVSFLPRPGAGLRSADPLPTAPVFAALLAVPLTLALIGVTAAVAIGRADGPDLGRAQAAGSLATVRGITVDSTIAGAVEAMLAAAESDGIVLTGGGHRDAAHQIELRRANCGVTHYAIHHAPASACSPSTARPGRSMHEHGLAVDFHHCGRGSPCFEWLSANAAAFGLFNLPAEPWHWSTSGR